MRTGDFARTFSQGAPRQALAGPMIEAMDYPEVLVARALSDGSRLEAVFYPGKESGAQRIPLSQLKPGRRYRVTGALDTEFIADANGEAGFRVELNGRTPVELEPAQRPPGKLASRLVLEGPGRCRNGRIASRRERLTVKQDAFNSLEQQREEHISQHRKVDDLGRQMTNYALCYWVNLPGGTAMCAPRIDLTMPGQD